MVDWYVFAEELQTSSFSTKIDGKVFCFLYLGGEFCCLPFRFTGLICTIGSIGMLCGIGATMSLGNGYLTSCMILSIDKQRHS